MNKVSQFEIDRTPPHACSSQPYFPHPNPSPVESCLQDFDILFIMGFLH